MTEAYRTGYVYIQEKYAGIIKETDIGYSFMYDRHYLSEKNAVSVSLTLPLKEGEYTSTTLFSFFDGLIPEGWLLDIASRNWKIDRSDRFGLLILVCEDCIGDVSVKSEVSL